MTVSVNTPISNEQYVKNLPKWNMVNDCINDEVKEKACNNASLCFAYGSANHRQRGYIIRDPNISDEAYWAFASRAVFKNYTGSTLGILMGSAFMRPFNLSGQSVNDSPQELPESISYIEDRFTRSGLGYKDSLKERMRQVASVGRNGVWVDFPSSAAGMSAAEIRMNGLMATAVEFKANEIEDWSERIIGGVRKLNYVKLCQKYDEVVKSGNSFNRQCYNVITELYLDDDGLYVVKVDDSTNEYEYQPTLGNGQRLDWIPFQFYGSQDNTPDVDPSPLFKIAEINIALFNSDATMRQALWLYGSPTATFSLNDGVDPQEFMRINGIADGESPAFGGTAYVGCEIGLAQIGMDSMLSDAMDKDVESMAQIGAQIITVGQNETAEAARIRKSSGMASLSDIVDNMEQGDRRVIEWMSRFNNQSGEADEFILELNRKFFADNVTPQMLQQLIAMNMQGKLPDAYLFKVLKENGLTLDNDDVMDYLERLGSDIGTNSINPDDE